MVETGGLEAGDVKFKPGRNVPMEHDGTGARGAPVTLTGEMSVSAAAGGDFVIGQYADDPAEHEGRKIDVRVGMLVLVARCGANGAAAGDLLAADGADGLAADPAGDGTVTPSDYAPVALEPATEGDLFLVAYP